LLYNAIPKIEPIMRYLGAAYILWLAWALFNEHKKEGKKSLETNSIITGAALQFINVKVIIYSITVMSTFVLPYYKDIWSIILFIIILAVVGFSSTCVWTLFGSVFEKVFRERKKLVNIVMALLLVYCAATIIIKH
jgi:threonine/homoserine/homoserine lactone efflux protein